MVLGRGAVFNERVTPVLSPGNRTFMCPGEAWRKGVEPLGDVAKSAEGLW